MSARACGERDANASLFVAVLRAEAVPSRPLAFVLAALRAALAGARPRSGVDLCLEPLLGVLRLPPPQQRVVEERGLGVPQGDVLLVAVRGMALVTLGHRLAREVLPDVVHSSAERLQRVFH